MRALAKLKHLETEECRQKIIRNLSRIMDIRIIAIDIDTQILYFLFEGPLTFDKVKQELWRIGYPITKYKCQNGKNSKSSRFNHTAALI
ncbi:MAG: hypothetical protein AAFZ89_11600 [Bacteroidota bacterium]